MITIASGILLAILFLALLPLIIRVGIVMVGIGVILIALIAGGWLLFAGAQSSEGFAIELMVGGVFLVWLYYERKARREIAEETASSEK